MHCTHDCRYVKDKIYFGPKYLYNSCRLSKILLSIAVLIYFPSKPPTPPSASASVKRTNFSEGLKVIIKDRNILLCTFGYAMSGGVPNAWQVLFFKEFPSTNSMFLIRNISALLTIS